MADYPRLNLGLSASQTLENELAETVLDTLQSRGPGLSGLGDRTVCKYGHRAAANTKNELDSRTVRGSLADYPRIANQQEQSP